MTEQEIIEDFLAQRRIAIVGVSRQPNDFSRSIFREFVKRGYDVVPVSPLADEIEGHPCVARLQEVQPRPDGVLLMTSPEVTEMVVRDCVDSGVRRVWMYRAAGEGAVSEQALELCRTNDIRVIPGRCPFMFLPNTQWFHKVHGLVLKIVGKYPE
jgi:uncharacterized protein